MITERLQELAALRSKRALTKEEHAELKSLQLQNEEAAQKRFREAREAQRQAEDAAAQAHRDAVGMAAVEQFKTRARAAFPGTDAEFAAQWPAIKAQWQQRQTLEAADNVLDQKRRQIAGL
jgi:hypothetical protein